MLMTSTFAHCPQQYLHSPGFGTSKQMTALLPTCFTTSSTPTGLLRSLIHYRLPFPPWVVLLHLWSFSVQLRIRHPQPVYAIYIHMFLSRVAGIAHLQYMFDVMLESCEIFLHSRIPFHPLWFAQLMNGSCDDDTSRAAVRCPRWPRYPPNVELKAHSRMLLSICVLGLAEQAYFLYYSSHDQTKYVMNKKSNYLVILKYAVCEPVFCAWLDSNPWAMRFFLGTGTDADPEFVVSEYHADWPHGSGRASRLLGRSRFPIEGARIDVIIFLIGGHDTTSYTMAWLLYELAKSRVTSAEPCCVSLIFFNFQL